MYSDAGALRRRLIRLPARWPEIHRQRAVQLLPAPALATLLPAAGCPPGPAAIGRDGPRLQASYAQAGPIRRRAILRDRAGETGILAAWVAELVAADGDWGPARAQAVL